MPGIPQYPFSSTADRRAIAFIIVWPFVFLWPYTLRLISFGNDFNYLYFFFKGYYLLSLVGGHFPLWSPTESAGYPFFSDPYAQPFYPLNAVYLVFFLLRGSISVWNYALFTIMALSIYGVGLYCWLRRLDLPVGVCTAAVLVALMSLKLTEILRFPNAIHSAAWMPWLLLGVTLAARSDGLRKGAIMVAISTVMLLTAGYPYFVVYTAFLIGPYFAIILFPRYRTAFLNVSPDQQSNSIQMILWIGTAFAAATAIASPWLLHVQAHLHQSNDRGIARYEFATDHAFRLKDTIGSWIFPPAASMEGWYYFGMATALLVATYLCCVAVGLERDRRHRIIVLTILPWFAFITYFTWGSDSALFSFVWQHTAIIDRMRVWGRLNIVLVPAIACMLALALNYLITVMTQARQQASNRDIRFLMAAFVTIALAAGAWQISMIVNRAFDYSWTEYFALGQSIWTSARAHATLLAVRLDERFFIVMTALAVAWLLISLLIVRKRHSWDVNKTVVRSVVALSIVDLFLMSNFQWAAPFAAHKMTVDQNFMQLINRGLDRPRRLDADTVDFFDLGNSVGILPNWNFIRHANVYLRFFDPEGKPRPDVPPSEIVAARRLYGADQRAQRLFVTSRIDYSSPVDFMSDVDATAAAADPRPVVLYYDGDTLRLDVQVSQPAWLSYIDNWDPNWRATLDGKNVPIELLFGSYKAVLLPAGKSTVEFSYQPGLFPYR